MNYLVSEPKADAWAPKVGICPDYELSQDAEPDQAKHLDNEIQTLLYPKELEALLRKIRSQAKTVVEETGSNVLYMAFGFLEWYESSDSDKKRLAPLLLIPTQLERAKLDYRTGTYRYSLS